MPSDRVNIHFLPKIFGVSSKSGIISGGRSVCWTEVARLPVEKKILPELCGKSWPIPKKFVSVNDQLDRMTVYCFEKGRIAVQ